MARKAVVKNVNIYHCIDCAHSFDYHEKGADGKPFLCRCQFHQFSKFLKTDYCNHFKKKI